MIGAATWSAEFSVLFDGSETVSRRIHRVRPAVSAAPKTGRTGELWGTRFGSSVDLRRLAWPLGD